MVPELAIAAGLAWLATVAVKTVAVVLVATVGALWVAGQVGTAKEVAEGAGEMVDDPRSKLTHQVVDHWDDPDWWQRHDVNREGGGAPLMRQLAGGAKIVKGVSGLAAPGVAPNPTGAGLTDGRSLADGAQTITHFLSQQGDETPAPPASDVPDEPGSEPADDSSTAPTVECTFVGSVEGGELVCREIEPGGSTTTEGESASPEESTGTPDGTYYARPAGEAAALVRGGDLEWDLSSNYVTIDTSGASELTVDGLITNGPDPTTDSGFSTEYRITSTEVPWWDEESRQWQVAVQVSRDGSSPQLFTATITPTGDLWVVYDLGAFPVWVTAVRDG